MIIRKPEIHTKEITSAGKLRRWLASYERTLKVGKNEMNVCVLVQCTMYYIKAEFPVRDTKFDGEYFPEKDPTHAEYVYRLRRKEEKGYHLERMYGIVVYFYFWSNEKIENIDIIETDADGNNFYRQTEIILPNEDDPQPYVDWYKDKMVVDEEGITNDIRYTLSYRYADIYEKMNLEYDKEYDQYWKGSLYTTNIVFGIDRR